MSAKHLQEFDRVINDVLRGDSPKIVKDGIRLDLYETNAWYQIIAPEPDDPVLELLIEIKDSEKLTDEYARELFDEVQQILENRLNRELELKLTGSPKYEEDEPDHIISYVDNGDLGYFMSKQFKLDTFPLES